MSANPQPTPPPRDSSLSSFDFRDDLPHTSFAFLSKRAARLFALYFNRKLRGTDARVVSTQVDVLAMIQLVKGKNVHLAQLAWLLGVEPCTLSRSVSRLIRKGLVLTRRQRGDGRARLAFLTEAGERALATAKQLLDDLVQPRLQHRLRPFTRILRTEWVRVVARIRRQMFEELQYRGNPVVSQMWTGVPEAEALLRIDAESRRQRRARQRGTPEGQAPPP